MKGDWKVQLEDGAHAIHAEISGFTGKLKIAWDATVIDVTQVWWILGDIKSFQRSGHSFLLSVRGPSYMGGSLVLSMDGVEIPPGTVATPVKSAPAAPTVQFVKELNVQDSEEVVAVEDYPLDNRFGNQPFSTVRQIQRESTNELSVDTGSQVGGTLGLDIMSVIKAEIAAHVSQQTGQKIGQTVTESQTLNFSVQANSAVIYRVVWKRKVRTGERLYLSGNTPVTVPYRINYGLSFEIRTEGQPASA